MLIKIPLMVTLLGAVLVSGCTRSETVVIESHAGAGVPEDFPRYNSTEGLITGK